MAHRQVAFEIAGDVPGAPPVMDPQGLESIKHEMLLGVDDTRRGSVARLWSRMEEPHCFLRADPLLYVKSNLHRDATEGVRRRIGDPKIRREGPPGVRPQRGRFPVGVSGPGIHLQFPNDKLAEDRARAALTTRALIPTWVDLVSADDLHRRDGLGRGRTGNDRHGPQDSDGAHLVGPDPDGGPHVAGRHIGGRPAAGNTTGPPRRFHSQSPTIPGPGPGCSVRNG